MHCSITREIPCLGQSHTTRVYCEAQNTVYINVSALTRQTHGNHAPSGTSNFGQSSSWRLSQRQTHLLWALFNTDFQLFLKTESSRCLIYCSWKFGMDMAENSKAWLKSPRVFLPKILNHEALSLGKLFLFSMQFNILHHRVEKRPLDNLHEKTTGEIRKWRFFNSS